VNEKDQEYTEAIKEEQRMIVKNKENGIIKVQNP